MVQHKNKTKYMIFENQNETLENKLLREKNAAEIESSIIISGRSRNGQHYGT